jgi:hypothetical protein
MERIRFIVVRDAAPAVETEGQQAGGAPESAPASAFRTASFHHFPNVIEDRELFVKRRRRPSILILEYIREEEKIRQKKVIYYHANKKL